MITIVGQLLHLFYPRPSNNHQAKIRQHSGLVGLIGLVLLAQVWLQVYSTIKPQVLGFASNISSESILQLTNQKRSDFGLHGLRLDQKLSQAAQSKAADMFARDYWAHVTPTGEQPWKFITATGYTYLYAGENLARDFADPQAVVDAWLASPTHRENLLNANYDDIGIAVVNGDLAGIETTLIVQMFGSRKVATQPAEVSKLAQATTPVARLIPTKIPTLEPTPTVKVVKMPFSPTPTKTMIATAITDSPFKPQPKFLINPFAINKSIGLAIAGLIGGVLLIDELVMRKKHLGRIAGRSWAHFAFLLTTLGMLWLSQQGSII